MGSARSRGSSADLAGKVCIVTGATSGIGYETALGLARLGARVIGVGRSAERCAASRESIRAASGNRRVSFEVVDLAAQEAIRAYAARMRRRFSRVDVLINNAGVFTARRRLSPDGLELQLAVNFLAPFLLTHELMPLLQAAGAARVATLGSGTHRRAKLHWLDLGLGGPYHGLRAYSHSKLACIMFAYELARRLGPASRITSFAVDPGLVYTDMGLKDSSPLVRLVWSSRRRRGSSPAAAARTSLYVASDPSAPLESGKHWKNCTTIPSSQASYDVEGSKRLWDLAERLVGIAAGSYGRPAGPGRAAGGRRDPAPLHSHSRPRR